MSNQLTAVAFSRSFEVVINPLKYWTITPGTLFFTVQQFETSNINSQLMIKIDNDRYGNIDLANIRFIEKDTDVYLVLKNTENTNTN